MPSTIRVTNADTDDSVKIDDTPVGVFRDPDRGEAVVAKKEGNIIPLGVKDTTVSREQDSENNPGYVEFIREDDQLYVRGAGSKNEITKESISDRKDLPTDQKVSIEDECVVNIGIGTKIIVEP